MNDKNKLPLEPSGTTLIPFILFVVVYLGTGLILQAQGVPMAFYQFPAPLAAMVGIIAAFIVLKGNFEEKFNTLVAGCGDANILIMCIIYLLAGGFAAVCKTMGGLDATVNLGLTYIPIEYMCAGIFIIASFISMATGTSVGSIVAVGPIAIGLAEKTGISLPLIMGCVMGGSMVGDNLSVISDTTIAATRTQGCAMSDKFKVNMWLTLIPAIITVVILFFFGRAEVTTTYVPKAYNLVKVLPYLLVLGTAVAGVNVFIVLMGGTIFAGAIGLYYGDFTLLSFAKTVYTGFTGMTEIFLLSFLIGGLAEMIRKAGGIQYLLNKAHVYINGKRTAELGIAFLVSIVNVAVANNTVAIIITGDLAKSICYKFKVDPRRSAALLDTYSNVVQGLLPYGAQMLIMTGFANGKVSPLDVLPYTWFLYLLAISATLSVFFPFSDGLIKHNPWDFEKQMSQENVIRSAAETD